MRTGGGSRAAVGVLAARFCGRSAADRALFAAAFRDTGSIPALFVENTAPNPQKCKPKNGYFPVFMKQ